MSEIYKQKEYELKSAIDNINSIPYIFEDYVKETNSYIDRLLEETKEINVLRNIIKEAIEYINTMPLTKGTEWYRIQLLDILKGVDKE